MRFLLSVLIFSACSWSQSQNPKPKDDHTTKTDTSREKPSTINPQPAGNVGTTSEDHQAGKIDNERLLAIYTQDLAKYTGRLAWYTFAVAAFTAVLVLVGLLQFSALSRQAEALKHHSVLIEQSVGQMKSAVTAYERYATTSEGALSLASQANDQTKESIELASKSLMLSHRPKLAVFTVCVDGEMSAFRAGSRPEGTFRVVNVGGTRAHLTAIYANAIVGDLRMKPVYEGQWGDALSQSLDPGQSLSHRFVRAEGNLAEGEIQPLLQGQRPFYVLGFIKYTDELDPPITRNTFFCRRLNVKTSRFEPVEDADYEHAD